MCGVCFVAESECGFGHHALRIEEPSLGSLPALPQDLFKHRLPQLPAVEDWGKPGQGLITYFRNERATVNLAVTHSFVMDHAVAQQPRLEALSNSFFFRISQKVSSCALLSLSAFSRSWRVEGNAAEAKEGGVFRGSAGADALYPVFVHRLARLFHAYGGEGLAKRKGVAARRGLTDQVG